ncbi:MAG TPA: VTT domain-containing protein, partial [Geminicoccaceae bacterium]|nr:VTT domain-containing protein [Geminicoccaceae bacterium]
MLRLFAIFVGLALLVLIPFLIWGEGLERSFGREGVVAWLADYGRWAWAAGILILASDLLLPIPATAVMAALGFVYGPLWGGLISTAGGFLGGLLGYGLCRGFGRPLAARLLGADGLAEGERLFARAGGWLVVLSRWLPIFPEVIACMAGLSRMPLATFLLALLCGSAPLGFAFAAIGHAGVAHPVLAIALSALAPPLLWLAVQAHL